jgi:hypothetical protein
VTPDGIIHHVTGDFSSAEFGDGGPAAKANVRFFSGWLALDGAGNIYLPEGAFADPGDTSNRIRKISTNGIITTIAGTGIPGYSGDGGQALSAQLDSPLGIAVDPQGKIYFAAQFPNVIRRLEPLAPPLAISNAPQLPSGTVGVPYSVTLAATGGSPSYAWKLVSGELPSGLALSSAGTIFGTPASPETVTFTIQVTDSSSSSASIAFTLTIGIADRRPIRRRFH